MKNLIYILCVVLVTFSGVASAENEEDRLIRLVAESEAEREAEREAEGCPNCTEIELREWRISDLKRRIEYLGECDGAFQAGCLHEVSELKDKLEALECPECAAAKKLEAENQAKLAEAAKQERRAQLKSGKANVGSMRDAELITDRLSLFDLAGSPMLNADGKIYQGNVRIDLQEGKLLRVQSEIMGITERRYPRYVYLKFTKKTINFSPDNMRIGSTINVIGKYAGNINYRTVGGVIKSAPIIECAYVGR